jgi:membrane protein implicated in regulation of membrane protease activity
MLETSPTVLVWFIIGLVLMLSELVIPGFIIIFFGAGAWCVALLMLIGINPPFNAQLLIFLVASLGSLLIFRRYSKQYFHGKVLNRVDDDKILDDYKGHKAIVKFDIKSNDLGGKVEFHGTLWNAVADCDIPKNAQVEIIDRDNITLKVKPLK